MTQIDLFYDDVFISEFKWICKFFGLKIIKMYMLTFIQGMKIWLCSTLDVTPHDILSVIKFKLFLKMAFKFSFSKPYITHMNTNNLAYAF